MHWLFRTFIWIGIFISTILICVWLWARPETPSDFYLPPENYQALELGTLIRVTPFSKGIPKGASGLLVLYATQDTHAQPAVASAIVVLPEQTTSFEQAIVWAHGTTGVNSGCAPSLLDEPFANVPALHEAIEQGLPVIATDYMGLGTPFSHPYLIGRGQAYSVLDSVRAARQLTELEALKSVVVWGHSQGGHSALWSGIEATNYLPDVKVSGIAALAPASDLVGLIDAVKNTIAGRITSLYLLQSYSNSYSGIRFSDYVSGLKIPLARSITSRCLAGPEALLSVLEASIIGDQTFNNDPTSGPLGEQLENNTPTQIHNIPTLIAQGSLDELVLPQIQERFADALCARGLKLDYREYTGRDHLSLVAEDSELIPELMSWTQARFNQQATNISCPK